MSSGPPTTAVTKPIGSILLVEDERDLRFILATQLRAAGFETIESDSGTDCLKTARERNPDVIIMDVGLPGLDGISTTRTLKADTQTAHIPVIMLTARSRATDVVRGLEAGAQEYLFKPFDVSELLARVRTVHRLARAHQELASMNLHLEAEVAKKTRRLQALYDFMRDLNRADTQDDVLDLVIRCIESMSGARRISVFLTNPITHQLYCARSIGLSAEQASTITVSNREGITGQVYQSGKTLAAKTIGDGNRDYERDAFVSAPIVCTSSNMREGVLGVINVTDKSDDTPFADEEIECIRSVADATAITLEDLHRRDQLKQSVRVLLQTLGNLAEYRDEETTRHLERVSKLARILAKSAREQGPYVHEINEKFVDSLVQAAPMHDIGKVGIPDEILTKPGKLTDEEFQIMKTHADIGRRVLSKAVDPRSPNPLLQMCIEIAWCHHERFDGTGYPRRLSGSVIPLAARIVALVDAYDAITSRRRYKPPKSHDEAVQIIKSESGRHFDPVLVEAFLRSQNEFNAIRATYEDLTDDDAIPGAIAHATSSPRS